MRVYEPDRITGERTTSSFLCFGVGNNINISESILAVTDIGISFQPGKRKETYRDSTLTFKEFYSSIPYFRLGLDAEISKWLDIRMGAYKSWRKHVMEPPGRLRSKESWGYADTGIYLGIGAHISNLDIDALLDPGFLTRGPYLISGSDGDLALQVSIRYRWGD